MCTTTSPDLPISAHIMHKYVVGLATLKTMMLMLSGELDMGARVVYPNAMEGRFRFHMDSKGEHTNTIKDYQPWHQYVTIDQHEDVKQLGFDCCLSLNDV